MDSISLDNASNDFDNVVARVLSDSEPTIVTTPEGSSVVVMTLADYNGWQETAYLLSEEANAARLQRSIADAKSGKLLERDLVE